MLSQGAFNALLKTLEEPPSYVIFILATTEPHKIPATILSRCQRFDFKRVTVKDMSTRMKEICDDVNVVVDDRALNLIARNSQGALRDALSILDQCMSFSENDIEYKDVVDLLGTVNIEQLFEMAEYVIKEDTKKCLEILNEFVVWGKDIKNLIDDLIDHFRNLMVCKVSSDLDEIISLPEEIVEQLKAQASTIEVNDIIRILNILSTTQDAIKVSSNPRVLAEVSIMKLSQPMFDESKESLLKRISNLEEVIKSGKININNNVEIESKKEDKETSEKNEVEAEEEVFYEEVKSEDVELIEKSWENILTHIKKDKNMPVYAILREAKEFNVSANNLYIVFDDNFAFAKNKLSDEKTRNYIESVIREILNRSFGIKIILKSESKNIKLEIEKEQKDKGEEILKSVFPKEIIDIKQSINENEIK